MQSLERNGYTREQVIDALHAERRQILFRYELLDRDNKHKRWLAGVIGGEIICEYENPVKRVATFNMKDDIQINWASDRIRPWVRLVMPDGGHVEWPQGIFLLTSPTRDINDLGIPMRSVKAYDFGLILGEHKVDKRYGILPDTNYIEAVRSLLKFAGITSTNLEPTSEVTPDAMEWDAGTPRLDIINDLLHQINYTELFFDEHGVATARKYREPDHRPVDYAYVLDERSVTKQAMTDEFDFFDVPNKWTMVVSHPDVVLSATFVNDDPKSPTSTVSRGRTISRYIEGVEASSQQMLIDLVRREAIEDTQANRDITFRTALMPFHGINNTLRLDFPGTIEGQKFIEMGWTMRLEAGSEMRHHVRRVVKL